MTELSEFMKLLHEEDNANLTVLKESELHCKSKMTKHKITSHLSPETTLY